MNQSLTKFFTFAIFFIAFLLIFSNFYWMGIILFIIGIILLTIREEDGFLKNSFDEAMNAQGSYPSGKLETYTRITSKQLVKNIITDKDVKYKPRYPKNLHKASKGILDEINDLFK